MIMTAKTLNGLGGKNLMTQSKKQSLKETMTNTGVGMVGSWLITVGCLSLWSNPVISATVATIGCTVWSIGRGYTIRRYFNKLNEKGEQNVG